MHAALLGLSHPHSGALLATLENLPEIRRISLWDGATTRGPTPALPVSRKARPVQADLDSVLAACDFAIVATRHDRAAAWSRRVIAVGKHLLAEKPVGLTADEVAHLRDLAARRGVLASVLYPRRMHPCAQAMRKRATAGELGPILSMEARFLATQVRFRDPNAWLFKRRFAGGGILLWLGSHYLDLLQYVSGDDITGVSARLARRSGEAIEVEDTAALALEFRSGAVGTFHAGYALAFGGSGYLNAAGYDAYLGLNGRQGRLVWPGLAPLLQVELPSVRRTQRFRIRPSTSYSGILGHRFVRQFIHAIRGQAVLPADLTDALKVARIVTAAAASARLGRHERVRC